LVFETSTIDHSVTSPDEGKDSNLLCGVNSGPRAVVEGRPALSAVELIARQSSARHFRVDRLLLSARRVTRSVRSNSEGDHFFLLFPFFDFFMASSSSFVSGRFRRLLHIAPRGALLFCRGHSSSPRQCWFKQLAWLPAVTRILAD